MLIIYIIIACVVASIMLWLCKQAGAEESNYSDDPMEPAESLSILEIIFSIAMGIFWPAATVAAIVVAVTELNKED